MADMPEKAPHPVNCSYGGKHTPRSAEMKIDGIPVKFEKCSKCDKRIGERKN